MVLDFGLSSTLFRQTGFEEIGIGGINLEDLDAQSSGTETNQVLTTTDWTDLTGAEITVNAKSGDYVIIPWTAAGTLTESDQNIQYRVIVSGAGVITNSGGIHGVNAGGQPDSASGLGFDTIVADERKTYKLQALKSTAVGTSTVTHWTFQTMKFLGRNNT